VPAGHAEIPALPILLPLGLVLMAAAWALLRRRGQLTAPRLGAAWLAGWYAVAVLGATMLPLHLAWGEGSGGPELYRILLVPIRDMRVDDFVLNVVMTLPVAALLHTVFGIREKGRVVLLGFLASAAVESTQLVLLLTVHGNRWADVHDLIANTLGAWLGYLAFRRLLCVDAVRRVVESCSPVRLDPRPRRPVERAPRV
jgi:glycopeptide antibiotics resistance protein